MTEGIVTLEEMKGLEPYVTGGGDTFRAQVIAYHNEKGPAARAETVIDAATRPARVVAWRRMAPLAAEAALLAFDPEASGLRTTNGAPQRRVAAGATR